MGVSLSRCFDLGAPLLSDEMAELVADLVDDGEREGVRRSMKGSFQRRI